MTRNQLIDAVEAEAIKARNADDWGRFNALRDFENWLCNAPSENNRKRGVMCFTMREALKFWKGMNNAKATR